jgi:hypothetical protein
MALNRLCRKHYALLIADAFCSPLIYSRGSSMFTPARSALVRMRVEPPGTVMASSINATCPQAWIPNPEQGELSVTRGDMRHHLRCNGDNLPCQVTHATIRCANRSSRPWSAS